MDTLNEEIKNKIINTLNSSSLGASSSEISKKIQHNRVTVTKYLEIMRAQQLVEYTDVAQAKLWTLKKEKKTQSKTKILIVDDEPHISELINLSLDSKKYETSQAYDGNAALQHIFGQTPDIVILDLMLPQINGFEVCKLMKQNPLTKNIPVLILSAKTEMNDKVKGIDVGANDYMTKPFDPSEVEHRIEQLLAASSSNTACKINPISNLCTIEHSTKNNDTTNIEFSIQNIDTYKQKYGNQKTNQSLKIIANLINNTLKENDTKANLYHSNEGKFLLECTKQNLYEKIEELFDKTLPFLYSQEDFENINKLKLKKTVMVKPI